MNAEIQRIKGTKDLVGADSLALKDIQDKLQAFFASHGYASIDTPLLEETRLFLRKLGGELASKLYTFADPGGNEVSLRPEFTASVMRVYIDKESELPLPVRWQYAGPVFRYERAETSEYRQFTQQGIELIGSASPLADVEVLTLACRGIRKLGIERSRLVLGHVGILLGLLEGLGLSDRIKILLVNSIAELSGDPGAAQGMGERIVRHGLLALPDNRQRLGTFLSALDEEEAKAIVQDLLLDATPPVGRRELDEIVSRFVRKLKEAAEPTKVEKGVELCARLSQVRGEPGEAIDQARRSALECGFDPAPLDDLTRLVALLTESDLGDTQVTVDLGLARGLAYYTGMVFEIHHNSLPLCGGGRYDGLVRALRGGKDVPSLGFAYGLEGLRQAQTVVGRSETVGKSAEVLVSWAEPGAYARALRLAESLRERGNRVEMDVDQRALEENIRYAKRRGMAEVVIVQEDGRTEQYSISGREP